MSISRIDERCVLHFSLMLAVLISLTIPIVNCGDDNPTPTTPRLDIQLGVYGQFFNSDGESSIRRYQVLLDTVVVHDVTHPTAFFGDTFRVTPRPVAKGAHRLELRILSQTYSLATYETLGMSLIIVDPNTPWTPGDPQISDKKQQLATGQGIVWDFETR